MSVEKKLRRLNLKQTSILSGILSLVSLLGVACQGDQLGSGLLEDKSRSFEFTRLNLSQREAKADTDGVDNIFSAIDTDLKIALQSGFKDKKIFAIDSGDAEAILNSIEIKRIGKETWSETVNAGSANMVTSGIVETYSVHFQSTINAEGIELPLSAVIGNLALTREAKVKSDGNVTLDGEILRPILLRLPAQVTNFFKNRFDKLKLERNKEKTTTNEMFDSMAEKTAAGPTKFQILLFQNVLQPLCIDMVSLEVGKHTAADCEASSAYASR